MTHPEICDRAVLSYCELNPNDQYCSCIKSIAAVKGVINPKCVDAACLRTGYLTTNMQSTQCPTVINCEINATLVNSGMSVYTSIPIEQNCGGSNNGSGSVPGVVETTVKEQPVPSQSPQSPQSSLADFKYLIIFIFLVVILIAIIGVSLSYDVFSFNETVTPY